MKEKPLMPLDDLADQLREVDYERYAMTLFAPRRVRPFLWVLYLLDHELAQIGNKTREHMMGLIRLQWWRDTISAVYRGNVPNHPLLKALHRILQDGAPWREEEFQSLIDAYEAMHENRIATVSLPLLVMVDRLSAHRVPQESLEKIAIAYDGMRQVKPYAAELDQIPLMDVKSSLILYFYLIVCHDLRCRIKHNSDLGAVYQSSQIFMLPLYLLWGQVNYRFTLFVAELRTNIVSKFFFLIVLNECL